MSFAMTAKQAALPTKAEAARPTAATLRSNPFVGNQAALRRLSPAPLGLQPKLEIGAVDDPLEREADEVADKVMRMPDPSLTVSRSLPRVSRKCAACEEEEKKVRRKCAACDAQDKKAQRKPAGGGDFLDSAPTSVDRALESAGAPLNSEVSAFFEPRFGRSFADVRVHRDSSAAQSATDIGARAYAVGSDIVFASGAYAPETDGGRRLIAHELAHVTQQTGPAPKLARKPDDEPKDAGGDFELDIAEGGRKESEVVRRQPAPDAAAAKEPTREEEIAASRASEGDVAGVETPPSVSLYDFAIDGADLKPRHQQAIDALAQLVKLAGGVTNLNLEAIGNTDSSGPPSVNTPLSEKRAEAVQAALLKAAGLSAKVSWKGEDSPIASNDTAEGRKRNRRVDISFGLPALPNAKDPNKPDPDHPDPIPVPKGDEPPPPSGDDPEKDKGDKGDKDKGDKDKGDKDKRDKDKKDKDDGGNDDPVPPVCVAWPLGCLLFGAAVAAAILAATGAAVACALKLIPCGPTPPPILPPGTTKPPPTEDPRKKGDGRKEKACLAEDPDLPSGPLVIKKPDLMFHVDFEMKMSFKEDGPAAPAAGEAACRAYLGEYRQYVKGFFQIVRVDGRIENQAHPLETTTLSPGVFQEDGVKGQGPYGHRFTDSTRTAVRKQMPNDKFLPKRADGPIYEGEDAPGYRLSPPVEKLGPGDTFNMNLEFRGGAVDTSYGIPFSIGPWHSWSVSGSYTKPGGPTPLGNDAPGTPTPVRPYSGPVDGMKHPHIFYAGGLGANPPVGPAQVRASFTTKSGTHIATVPVNVVEAKPDSVTIQIPGPTPLDIAPTGEDPIVLIPGRKVKITRDVLSRWQ